MSHITDHQPATPAIPEIDANPDERRVSNKQGHGWTARVVGDPVVDPTPATLKLYDGDWTGFVAWCREQHRPSLPASSETLAAYLVNIAPGLRRGTLGRKRSAISTKHRQAGLPTPVLDAATHKALREAAKPKRASTRPAVTAATLARLARLCSRDLTGLRDRALLLLAAATLRPAPRGRRATGPENVDAVSAPATGVARLFVLALDAEDVRFTRTGVELQLKTRMDEAVPGRMVTLTRASTANCPVRALEEWLRSSETAFGPVFRKVNRWGNVEHGRLGADAWHRILARRTKTPSTILTAKTAR